MGRLLKGRHAPRLRSAVRSLHAVALLAPLPAALGDDAHQWTLNADFAAGAADTRLHSWSEGGLGRLRFDEAGRGSSTGRLFAEYRGRITPTLWADVVVDYVPDASTGVDATEAYLEWRPLPKSPSRHRWRIGAFYPPFSVENGGNGWSSPLTISSSAVNTWLGEEVRPLGVQWSMRRPLGFTGSPHELGAFAAGFYGNDPAGTLLFWRGWAVHDRQTRLGDALPLPPQRLGEDPEGALQHELEPVHEIDGRPGFYAGVQWRYARRVALRLAHYDNRADPGAFDDGQWGWRTRFLHASAQIELPRRVGLLAQRLHGDTDWIVGTTTEGALPPDARLVSDEIDAWFVLLTRPIGERHSVTLRYDDFDYRRTGTSLAPDSGRARAVAYRYRASPRLSLGLEWLQIDSERDLNPVLFGAERRARERLLQLKLTLTAGSPAG